MKHLYIFDLDGTLAKIDHRLHYVKNGNKNWKAFFDECDKDYPNEPVIEILDALESSGQEIWIWSGRSDEVEEKTRQWLADNAIWCDDLRMRPAGDYTPDDKLKESWLHEMSEYDRRRLRVVFDDRNRLVEMYRRNGVTCLQVAPGDF